MSSEPPQTPNPHDPPGRPSPPPIPPFADYGWRGRYGDAPRPRTKPLYFAARAAGGFVLFFVTLFLADWIALKLGSGIAFFSVIGTTLGVLVVLSFVFHRRGWLSGWITGLLLAMALVGLLIFTCFSNWH